MGVVLRGEADFESVRHELDPNDFYDHRHRAIYAAINALAHRGVGVDLLTVHDALRSGPDTGHVEPSYLAGLCEAAPISSHLPHYLSIVKRDASRRKCLEVVRRIETSLRQSPQDKEENTTDRLIQELNQLHQAEGHIPSKWQTACELMNAAHVSVEWLWEGFLARGLITLLSARPKLGKTTLLFHLLTALFHRQPFLDRATDPPGKVLLCTEEGPVLLKRRLERLGLGEDDLLILPRSAMTGRRTGWTETIQQIRLAARQGVCLVIIDTLAAFWDVEDENDAPKAGAALLPLQTLAQQRGIAVLLVHHLRKTPGEEGTAHRGSGAIVAAVDMAIEMGRDPQKSNRRRLTALSRFDETPQQLVIELEGGTYRSKGSPEAVGRAEVKEQVLGGLPGPEEDPIERDALLEQLDPKPSTSLLKEVLRGLVEDEELVERLGAGRRGDPYRYRLAADFHSATYIPPSVAESNPPASPGQPATPSPQLSQDASRAVRLIQEVFPGTELCQADDKGRGTPP